MTDKVLKFGPGVGVGEGAALWLEVRADLLVWQEHIESCKEDVVCQCNDALRGQ